MPRVGIVAVLFEQPDDEIATFVRSVNRLSYPISCLYLVNNKVERDCRRHIDFSDSVLVSVIEAGGNLGFTGGANVGVRQALDDGCQLILLLNTDISLLRTDLVERLQEPFAADRLCGMASPVILQAPREDRIWYAGANVGSWSGIPHHLGIGRRYRTVREPSALPTQVSSGCCVLISRQCYREVGGFDEGFFAYFDEVDLSLRARACGYRIYLWPEALIAHWKNGRVLSPTEAYYMTRNSFVFIRKHMTPLRLPIAVLCQLFVALPTYFMRSRSRAARRQWRYGAHDGLLVLVGSRAEGGKENSSEE